jgi:chorismate mutase
MAKADQEPLSLDALRERIDQIDGDLLKLIDERASLAVDVAKAKAATGDVGKFGLKVGREAALMRRLLSTPRKAASASLVARIWRELMSDNLANQGPYHLSIWAGRDAARTTEAARRHFGATPPLRTYSKPEEALAAARTPGGVAVLGLSPDSAWWGRLLAEPKLKVFAALPALATWGPCEALAVADIETEPTGGDVTFWVTDAGGSAASIEESLGRDGVAASLLSEAGGLRLFTFLGYYMPDDERLARAPGRLSGVIGAAPAPFDV